MTAHAQETWESAEQEEPDFVLDEAEALAFIDENIDELDVRFGETETDAVEDSLAGPPLAAPVGPGEGAATHLIPRIRIHASTDRMEIESVLRSVARDRRLTRVELSIESGGLDAAILHCATNPSPDLLILDTTAGGRELLERLDRLAEHVDPGTKVLIIGASNDIGLFRELMRRGVSEYLVPPLQPLALISAIGALYADPEKPFAGRSIAVVGAKGGVGASTLSHNLAWLVAERFQANATLVDLDLAFGTAALDFNQEPAQTVAEALLAPDRMDEVFLDRLLTRQTERLMLFCAPATIDRDLDISDEAFETVLDSVRRATPYVVLDLPHLWSGWVRDAIVRADEIVVVATPELASLRNAKNLLDRMKAARALDTTPTLVLNMVGVPKRPEIPIKDFAEAIGVEPKVVIPFDPQIFGTAANNGQMIPELAPQSKIAASLEALATSLCGRDPQPRKKQSLLERLPLLKR